MYMNHYNSKKIHTFKPFLSKIGEKMSDYKNWYYLLSSLMIVSQCILFFIIRELFEKFKDQKVIIDLIFMFSFFLICFNTLIVMLLFYTFFCTGAAIFSELRGYEILTIAKTTIGEPSNEYFKFQLNELNQKN